MPPWTHPGARRVHVSLALIPPLLYVCWRVGSACMRVCACCVRSCMCVHVVCVHACVCMRACVHMHAHVHMFVHVRVCICVCVCMWSRHHTRDSCIRLRLVTEPPAFQVSLLRPNSQPAQPLWHRAGTCPATSAVLTYAGKTPVPAPVTALAPPPPLLPTCSAPGSPGCCPVCPSALLGAGALRCPGRGLQAWLWQLLGALPPY